MAAETPPYTDMRRIRIVAQPAHRSRRRGNVARLVSSVLLGGVVLLILAGTTGMMAGLWRFTVIDTGSMRPTLNPGDIAILTSERPADLRKGQIVAFHPPGDPRLTVIHRVVSLRRGRDGVAFRTKGDANNASDQWRPRIIGGTIWREDFKLPKLGYLAVWSQQRQVRMGILILVIALIVSMGMGWIWRTAPHPVDRKSAD